MLDMFNGLKEGIRQDRQKHSTCYINANKIVHFGFLNKT